MDDPRFVSATPEEIREALRKMKEAAMPEPIDHTAEARAEAEAQAYAPGDAEAQEDFITGWRTALRWQAAQQTEPSENEEAAWEKVKHLAPTWEGDPVARDAAVRWFHRGYEAGASLGERSARCLRPRLLLTTPCSVRPLRNLMT